MPFKLYTARILSLAPRPAKAEQLWRSVFPSFRPTDDCPHPNHLSGPQQPYVRPH